MKWAKKAGNNSTYDVAHKKMKPKTKKNFITDAKACQIFWGFEQLFSTVINRGISTQKHMQTAGF